MSEWISREVVITHAVGLHARPSVKLTKLAKTFPARLEIAANPQGPWIDAKSIVKVMAMKVPQHATLHLRGAGDGAGAALSALVGLVERDFDGEPADAAGA